MTDTKKAQENKRRDQQDSFKKGLITRKQEYNQDLAIRLQRVYNKPLMFETSYNTTDKIIRNKNIHEKVYDEINNQNNKSNYHKDASGFELKENDNVSYNKISNLKEEDDEYENRFDDV